MTCAATVGELVPPFLEQAGRILEPLEAERARVLDRVGDADDRHAALERVPLERDLGAREEFLGEEPVGRRRIAARQGGDLCIPAAVGPGLVDLHEVLLPADSVGVL